jgi:hypothetical protein
VRRRGTVNRKPEKPQNRKPNRPKRNNAQTTARQGSPSVADLQEKLDARTKQLNEAIEREKATAEVLRVISSSPSDAQPVFDAIAKHVPRLFKAPYCWVFRFDGTLIHFVPSTDYRLQSPKFFAAHTRCHSETALSPLVRFSAVPLWKSRIFMRTPPTNMATLRT